MDTGAEHLLLPPVLLNRIVSEMREGLFILDENENILLTNQAADELLGWEKGRGVVGWHFLDIVEAEDSKALLRACHTGKSVHQGRAALKKQDGTVIGVECTVLHLQQAQTSCTAILFHEQEQPAPGKEVEITVRLKPFFESSMFGVIYGDVHNRIFDANQEFLQMVGYPLEDFQQSKVGWRDLTPEEYLKFDEEAVCQIQESRSFKPYEKQYIRKDGQRIDVLVGGVVDENYPERVLAFVVDITAKKQFERALTEGDMLFRALAGSVPMLIWLLNPKGELIYMNKTLQESFGHSFANLKGRRWEQYIHPEDRFGEVALIEHALKTKTIFEYGDHRLLYADGTYQWFRSSAGPVFSRDGQYMGLIGVGFNIQDRKIAEEKLTQYTYRLEQSNKELEHFATIASHDLQEPLRKVLLFTDHLKKVETSLSEEGLDDLERIQRATGKMQHLINDLLDLSKITRRGEPFQQVDLALVMDEVIAELTFVFKDVRCRVMVNGNMTIEAAPNQMHQMLAQLLDNALRYHEPGVPSQVQVDIRPLEEGQCRISIEDNGIGMKAEHLPKIFDTFTRLHHGAEYPGTGIGLALVKKIVERHGGSIAVDSSPGEGSCFIVTLPVSQEQPADAASSG